MQSMCSLTVIVRLRRRFGSASTPYVARAAGSRGTGTARASRAAGRGRGRRRAPRARSRGACTSTRPYGIADERRAVERDRALGADAVRHDHERAVRDAVGADHLLPERLGVEVGMVGLGADRGGVHDHVGAEQRVRPRDLGEPLVPTGREAEARVVEIDDREAGVAGPEVAVLVVARGDRQVQLARARDERAVGRDDDRGVVAERVGRRRLAVRRATRARTRRSRPRARPRTRASGRRAAARARRPRLPGRRA